MIVAEVVRNSGWVTFSSYAPFVFCGIIKYRSLKTEWGTSVDDLFTTGQRVKVKQVTRDYLNKYLEQESLAECMAQEGSFYFDRVNQLVYVHVEHQWSQLTAPFDYGYAFGVCSQRLGYIYIDDYQFEPVITESTDVSLSADDVTVGQPKGSTSSLQMNNMERYNELTGLPEGVLDFILRENIDHNDVFVYNYQKGVLSKSAAYFIEDFDISEKEITLNLQDKRFS
jgi:hypothetical protein